MNDFTHALYQLMFALAASIIPLIWISLFIWVVVKIWKGIFRTARK